MKFKEIIKDINWKFLLVCIIRIIGEIFILTGLSIGIVWSLNHLFGFGLAYNWETILAMVILLIALLAIFSKETETKEMKKELIFLTMLYIAILSIFYGTITFISILVLNLLLKLNIPYNWKTILAGIIILFLLKYAISFPDD